MESDQAMIPSDTVITENEEMEEPTSAQADHIAQDAPKSSYAKRSNVVGMWRKREEAIKASNVKSKEKAREIEAEEKKESNQEFELDSRQQKIRHSETLPNDLKTVGFERNGPEQTSDTSSYRRSNIRDSWKKRSATSPSIHSSQPSPDIVGTASEKSHASMKNCISESNSNNTSIAFDELKSKWKKFGVQQEDNLKAEQDGKQIAESDVIGKSKETLNLSLDRSTQECTKQNTKSSGASQTSRALAARRIGSNRFRSRFDRKPSTSSSTDEISGSSVDGLDPERMLSEPTISTKGSPIQSQSLNEKDLFPPFPLDETNSNEPDFTDPGVHTTPKSPLTNFHQDSDVTPASPDSNISRSSLSTRANRRLRDMRMKNQSRKEDDNIAREIIVNSEPMPMDESTAFQKSQQSQSANVTSENAIGAQTSPLNGVVPNMEEMVPDQFFSEKDANVESFKTVYDKTSFGQIANDMREEASSLFELDILNEGVQGVHSALNTLGDALFQTTSPRKLTRRAPSPIEEVAIEVEYVADPEE